MGFNVAFCLILYQTSGGSSVDELCKFSNTRPEKKQQNNKRLYSALKKKNGLDVRRLREKMHLHGRQLG